MRPMPGGLRLRSTFVLAAVLALFAVTALAIVGGTASRAHAAATADLPQCPFWAGDVTVPPRSDTPFTKPEQTAPKLDVSDRLVPPADIAGSLGDDGTVTVTFARVPGAAAYRVWRDGVSVAWITDWGQDSLSATDTSPCQDATYTVMALSADNSDASSAGQLSQVYQLGDDGTLSPWQPPVGKHLHMMVTSYNNVGQTAIAYPTTLGTCAVDPRVIPWGTRFWVPDYGYCYAADIGYWIQGNTVDLWLPGQQAADWGVQHRDITILANDGTGPTTPPGSPTVSPTPPPACPAAWDSGTVYHAGDQVSHAGHAWRARYWTQGDEPGTGDKWGAWSDVGPCA